MYFWIWYCRLNKDLEKRTMLQIKAIFYQIDMFIAFDFCFSKNAILLNLLATCVCESSLAKLAAVLESISQSCWLSKRPQYLLTKRKKKNAVAAVGTWPCLVIFRICFCWFRGPKPESVDEVRLELHPRAREATLKTLTSHVKMLMLVLQMYLPRVVCHSMKYSVSFRSHTDWNGSCLDYDMHSVGLEYQLGFFSFSFLLHVLLHSRLQSLHSAAISANNSDVKITHFLTVLTPLLAYSQLLLKRKFPSFIRNTAAFMIGNLSGRLKVELKSCASANETF